MGTLNTTPEELIIIFLDIDGVILPFLNQPPQGTLFPDRTLEALSRILEVNVASTRLVLSSTWRVRQEFCRDILDAFNRHGYSYGGPLMGIQFYDITDPALHSTRQHEIYKWLIDHGNQNIKAWIALDDEELIHGKENSPYRKLFQNHVVKTDSHVGLTQGDADKAIELIQKQLEK